MFQRRAAIVAAVIGLAFGVQAAVAQTARADGPSCPSGQTAATYSRPSTGQLYTSTFGPYFGGQGFTALGSSISSLSVWMLIPTDGPTVLSVIEGESLDGPVVGSVQVPGEQTGKVTAVPDKPIAVTPGARYILKVSSPTSTRGQVERQASNPDDLGYYEGGRSLYYSMALEVGFCGSALTVQTHPPIDADFGAVHGSSYAGESFVAADASLLSAGIWLREANNGPLTVAVDEGSPSGTRVGSGTLAAGAAGKRTVTFPQPVRLEPGQTYVLVVSSGSPDTTSGVVARQADDPDAQGYTESGALAQDMAMELTFAPRVDNGLLDTSDCTSRLTLEPGYADSVESALRAKTDVWGDELIARPEGPTYANVKPFLEPLRTVGQPAGVSGTQLTDSGVYYIPMGAPGGDFAGPVALHVADGSQVVSDRATGRKATIYVGAKGTERYGLCEAQLDEPTLDRGYEPVLETRYHDIDGTGYTQESFTGVIPGSSTVASFIRLTARRGDGGPDHVTVRVTASDTGATAADGVVKSAGKALLYYSGGSAPDQVAYDLDLSDGKPHAVYLVRPVDPAPVADVEPGPAEHAGARAATEQAWDSRLQDGARFLVPERRVMDAQRNLLIQNLQQQWRYSIGNAYETFFQPESSEAVTDLARYGFTGTARDSLQYLAGKSKGSYVNWERGEQLSHAADYYLLTHDAAFIERNTPTYVSYMQEMAAERAADPHGLLPKEPVSGDIPQAVYGTHAQAVAWRGMRDMATVWGMIGRKDLADRYQPEAAAFGRALRTAIAASSVDVGKDETFVPLALYEPDQAPYDSITATRLGSYWNLVMPYAFASGIIDPTSDLGHRVWNYLHDHGSTLLGLQRFNYYGAAIGQAWPGGLPGYKTSGADNVYGVRRIDFLADQDVPDQLVLALYGKLAHGMTPNTFVSGEGDTIGPVDGEYFRSMYLPPDNANNDFFLATLHEMLVHATFGDDGAPAALHLAYSTPRGWLAEGKAIEVDRAPTPFGEVSYRIARTAAHTVDVSVDVPERTPADLRLRVRLPAGLAIANVVADDGQARGGVPFAGDTIDLTGRDGHVQLQVELRSAP